MLNSQFFSPGPVFDKVVATHIVIPTSVVHHYDDGRGKTATRNAIYIKKYESTNQEINSEAKNPLVFFHGGPCIVNQEQFSILTSHFTQRGYTVYIPEIEGSLMYYEENQVPDGFVPSMVPEHLKLLSLNGFYASGLNEFTKNYADDVKDVIEHVSKQHANKKVNIVAHSLGCHQVLRTLQHVTDLNQKIEAICNVAGSYDNGVNRFRVGLNDMAYYSDIEAASRAFYRTIEGDSENYFKSRGANANQPGPEITKSANPIVNQQMNEEISVCYGDVTGFPPILLLHAKDDKSVFFQSSVLLYAKIQQQGAVVNGLFLDTGGHQFIKNEGDAEIRNRAFVKMYNFFNNPMQKTHEDLSTLDYDDVVAERTLFLANQEAYLQSKFSPPVTPAP